jgi:hypothetical protein
MSDSLSGPRLIKGRQLICSRLTFTEPIMNARNTGTSVSARVATLCAAVVMTTLTLGTQLGLVAHYTSGNHPAVLAAHRAAPVAQTVSGVAPQRRKS